MIIDRETGTIKRVLDSTTDLKSIVGDRNSLSFTNLPEVFRLSKIEGQDLQIIRRTYSSNDQRDVCFAFIQLSDKFGQHLGDQFFTPFSYKDTTILDLYNYIKAKLLAIKQNPNNMLGDFDHENFNLFSMTFP